MERDIRGLVVTTTSTEAVAALDGAVGALLAHRADLGERLKATFALDPHLLAAHVLAGFAALMQAREALHPQALHHLTAARASARERGATAREAAFIEALAAWAERGEMDVAASLLEGALRAAPLDALALKLSHGIRFMLGDAVAMRLAVESALPAWGRDVPGQGYILGCHAFALEETGDRAAAELSGRAGVMLAPDDLWGAHAVAHVMEGEGRARQGLAWIGALQPRLAAGGAFGRHLHWHAALFHLHAGDGDAALALFDGSVAAGLCEDRRDFANAASLLWRLEAQGVAIGRRWEALAEHATTRSGVVFFELHQLLALAAARRPVALAQQLDLLRRQAMTGTDTQSRLLARIGLPAAAGLLAAARGDARGAVAALLPIHDGLRAIGGSHAQRDLFERLLIRAVRDSGDTALLDRLLTTRAARRAPGAWEAACVLPRAIAA